MAIDISTIVHPLYKSRERDWYKWRMTMESGSWYKDEYLKRFEKSEERKEFLARKFISYVPAFSKTAILEIRNNIFKRMSDISRIGGSQSYQNATSGKNGGVDLLGNSMTMFIGTQVLIELLSMGKVGIYVDMPPLRGQTMADNRDLRPYVYVYKIEDIRSWNDDESHTINNYKALLLRDHVYVNTNDFPGAIGLPHSTAVRYRYYWRDDNGDVFCQFYDHQGGTMSPFMGMGMMTTGLAGGMGVGLGMNIDTTQGMQNKGIAQLDQANIDIYGPDYTGPVKLNIGRIPFICLELNNSLLADIADYQIALMNIESTDINYLISANFPFYTEQFDSRWEASHLKQGVKSHMDPVSGEVTIHDDARGEGHSVQVGPVSGRRYNKDLDRPGFISPSIEPITASMKKQEQMKQDIRLLINLGLIDIAKNSSEDDENDGSPESGLSYIARLLEDGEQQIGDIWALYENRGKPFGSNGNDLLIKYPKHFSLATDKQRFEEVEALKKHMSSVPSLTFKKEIAKRIAEILVGTRVTAATLISIYKDIDKADVIDVIIDKLEKDVAEGILSHKLAAKLRGYPDGDVDVAQAEEMERLKAIQMSQAPGGGMGATLTGDTDVSKITLMPTVQNPAARGVKELSTNPKKDVRAEKAAAGNPVRGEGK